MKRLAVLLLIAVVLSAAAPTAFADEALGAPREFTAERDGNRIFLSWEPPAGNATVVEYIVYRGTEPGNLTFYGTVDANFTAGYDPEVLRGTTYYYAVSAIGTEGESPWSQIVKVSPPSDELPALIMTAIIAVVVVTLLFAYWKGKGS
jgi:fibronectin type 3 domain-containing protein